MATPSIQGLFGGMGTPEEMQQQAIQAKATQFAQLTPDQQLGVMGYKGGANLGRGIAGAFGVEVQDPTIQRATRLRQLASQYNTNTAKGLREMAAAVRGMGDYESSDMLIKRAEEMEKNEVELGYKQAQTTKALTAKETSTASERNRKLIADAEVKLVEGKPLSNAELANLRWLSMLKFVCYPTWTRQNQIYSTIIELLYLRLATILMPMIGKCLAPARLDRPSNLKQT